MAESTPLIGITTYGRNENNQFPLPAEYVDSVRRAGGVPVLLTPGEQRLADLLECVDGLILAGGGDVSPDHYDGVHHETIYMLDAERDTFELELARHALESGMPTLAICRGCQIINIVLGGTLHEHVPDVFGDEVPHRLPPREPTEHIVNVLPDSALAAILGDHQVSCASWHHQAIRDVADDLEVVAHAPDGTIEAVEMTSHPWMYGVQWHPELTSDREPAQQRLFDALVQKSLVFREYER